MHLGETDTFLMQIKRKISVIFTAKPMHLFIQETMITIMVTFAIGQFYSRRKQPTFPEATSGFPRGSVNMTPGQLLCRREFTPSRGSVFVYMKMSYWRRSHAGCTSQSENSTPVQNFVAVSCKCEITTLPV